MKVLLAVDEHEAKRMFIDEPLYDLDRQSDICLIAQSRFTELKESCEQDLINAKQDAEKILEDAYNLGYESGRKNMFLLLNDETNKDLKFIEGCREKYLGRNK